MVFTIYEVLWNNDGIINIITIIFTRSDINHPFFNYITNN
jgi:hypothetical protein